MSCVLDAAATKWSTSDAESPDKQTSRAVPARAAANQTLICMQAMQGQYWHYEARARGPITQNRPHAGISAEKTRVSQWKMLEQ